MRLVLRLRIDRLLESSILLYNSDVIVSLDLIIVKNFGFMIIH